MLVVGVVGADDGDAARLRALAPGAGVVPVALSRADLERRMDSLEAQLQATGEFASFLQLSADGFTGIVLLVVDAPAPRAEAWAAQEWGDGGLLVEVLPPA